MNAPALVNITVPSLTMSEAELLRVLEASVYPGAKLESIKLVIGYCRGQNLDPMLKPVHIVPMNVKKSGTKDQYDWRDVIMPGIGLYRTLAARTGEYAGCSQPKFGISKELKIGEFSMDYPAWCEVTVRRIVQGQIVEFTALEFWLENYATDGRNSTTPNTMWRKRPMGQLAKCAEAQALRKAFPEVGAQPTAEELEGKVIELGNALAIEGEATTIEQPQPKSKPVKPPEWKEPDAPQPEEKQITAGAIGTIKKQMERASLSTIDLQARFGRDAEGKLIEGWTIHLLPMSAVNDVLEWIKDPQGQK